MISGIIGIINQLLTFYIPTFYTFRFLMNNEAAKIRIILKFWCVLTIYHLMQWILSNIIAENIFPIIDLIVLIALNCKEMHYAEFIFDKAISPAYNNNKDSLQKISIEAEKIFNKKTASLKNHVADSTIQKFKGIIGEILVGTLNPNLKKKSSDQQESVRDQDNNDQDEQRDD